ncbi:MAG TPA: sigma-70 family RNA polymerase sigma factor [Polyangia bacterium]|jgi:RNA polymerase sigma-70 factor (ECF subfamily)|nr:sigma-70 family RNA polymerase sigma factor [Polyangia bacterium]
MDRLTTKTDARSADQLARLATEARAGDTRALEQLLLALLPRTRNLVRYLIGGDPDVDDVAQTALWAIARKLHTFEGRSALTAWTDRIVARAAFAEIRRRASRPKVVAESPLESVPTTGAVIADYLARRWMVRLLDQLPTEQRDVVVLHHVMELTVPEVAEETGAGEETVRSRLRLAKARLRELGAAVGASDEDRIDD